MMRLLCLHADTVNALQRLGTKVEDLTPSGLWNTPYHLVTVSIEQRDALQRLRVTLDDVTPTVLRDGALSPATASAGAHVGAQGASATQATSIPPRAAGSAGASTASAAIPSPT
jgi:hypothetical protein